MDATTAPADATREGEWVLLEIFGHRRHFGLLTEIERFGSKLARMDEYRPGEDQPANTHYYGGAAIFSITPITEDSARRQTAYFTPPAVQSLPAPDDEEQPF